LRRFFLLATGALPVVTGVAAAGSACRSTEGTPGAPQKMRRQDAATQEPTNQVFGGDAHGLSLPQARSTQPRRAALALSLTTISPRF
jgi:hypothetical protein